MKESLIRFVKQIIDSLSIDIADYQVFSKDELLPEIFIDISFKSEYLVCLWVDEQKISEICASYELFLNRRVEKKSNVLYWFEGKVLNVETNNNIENSFISETAELDQIDGIKNSITLPTWLQLSIFERLSAEYAPDFQKFERNSDLTNDGLKAYLGTYFPRSYSESFAIFDNVFQNKVYLNLATKEEINILDIGSGSGGNILGLLAAINKYSVATRLVNIIAVDAHAKALSIASDLVNEFSTKTSFKISITTKCETLKTVDDLRWIKDLSFDFISSFKMGCELIAIGERDAYYNLTRFSLPKLSDTGLFILLDVTTKVAEIYNPVLMNSQINTALRELGDYKTLIPISCGGYEDECNESCFTQQYFYVTHQKKIEDLSKVTYRVIGRCFFIDQISLFDVKCKYLNMNNTMIEYCKKSIGTSMRNNFKI